jgi:ABC-type phosphate transport system permease subunit
MMRHAAFSRNLMLSCGTAILAAIVLLTVQATRLHQQFLQQQIDIRLQNVASLLGPMFNKPWPQEAFHHVAAAGILVLLTVLIGMNSIAVFLRFHFNKNKQS